MTEEEVTAGPAWLSPKKVRQKYGVGNTKLYSLLGRGAIKAKKFGASTLIDASSVEQFFASLPDYQSKSAA